MRSPRSSNSARLLSLAGLAMSASHSSAQCPWSSQFSSAATGLNAPAYCLQVFDPDGPGPLPAELYIGGSFLTAGGVLAPRLAKWNGSVWTSLGILGTDVRALGLHDPDGAGPALPVLVAAGTFTSAGGTPVNNIASWDGQHWSAMGTPQPWFNPSGIADFDPDGPGPLPSIMVVAALSVEDPNQVNFGGITTWNGQTWTQPAGYSPDGRAIAVFDQDGPGPENESVFIGTSETPGIWRWDGANWNIVGGGFTRSLPYICNTLRVIDEDGPGPGRPALFAGGSFTGAGGFGANGIARWNGAAWSGMGSGHADVNDFAIADRPGLPPIMYAVSLSGVVRWEPTQQVWSTTGTLDGTSIFAPAMRLATYSGPDPTPSLYLSGFASTIDSIPLFGIARTSCSCYANCDGSAANPLLTANDFQCFLNRFAQQNAYANCDGSTNLPTLTANDFQCYLNAYASGCP